MNLIYGIHCSYHSILISWFIEIIVNICWSHFRYYYSNVSPCIYFIFFYLSYSTLFIPILLLLWLSIIIRLVDYLIESFIMLTIIEQLALIVGIKLLSLPELMLSFACLRCYIDSRSISTLIFYFPLLSCYSFPIPSANPLIPLFPSPPIQGSQIFIKIGFLNYPIEGLGQPSAAGFYFIIPQGKEFISPYSSSTDRSIGSIHHLTTGLHGFHVLLGPSLFFIISFYISLISPFYFMEFSLPLFLSSHHWHFADFIWFLVFSLYIS